MTSDEVRTVIADSITGVVEVEEPPGSGYWVMRDPDDVIKVDLHGIVRNSVKSVEHGELVERGYVDAITDAVIAALAGAGVVIGERVELTSEQEEHIESSIDGEYVSPMLTEMGLALVRVVTP